MEGRKNKKKNDVTLCNNVLLSVRDHFKHPKIEEDRYDIIGKGFAVRLRNLEKKTMNYS